MTGTRRSSRLTDLSDPAGAYRGGFPGVSGNPFGFFTSIETLRNVKDFRIWNLSWNRTSFKLLPWLSNSFSHDGNTYSNVLNYNFGEKIEIL